MKYIKILFFVINILLIIFYLYPGSIFGCIYYKDCSVQPNLTKDFIISSNHFYTFLLFSLLGFYLYLNKNRKIIIIYILSLSVILELMHIIIPNRSFQFSDLFGNVIGILVSLIITKYVNKWRKRNELI